MVSVRTDGIEAKRFQIPGVTHSQSKTGASAVMSDQPRIASPPSSRDWTTLRRMQPRDSSAYENEPPLGREMRNWETLRSPANSLPDHTEAGADAHDGRVEATRAHMEGMRQAREARDEIWAMDAAVRARQRHFLNIARAINEDSDESEETEEVEEAEEAEEAEGVAAEEAEGVASEEAEGVAAEAEGSGAAGMAEIARAVRHLLMTLDPRLTRVHRLEASALPSRGVAAARRVRDNGFITPPRRRPAIESDVDPPPPPPHARLPSARRVSHRSISAHISPLRPMSLDADIDPIMRHEQTTPTSTETTNTAHVNMNACGSTDTETLKEMMNWLYNQTDLISEDAYLKLCNKLKEEYDAASSADDNQQVHIVRIINRRQQWPPPPMPPSSPLPPYPTPLPTPQPTPQPTSRLPSMGEVSGEQELRGWMAPVYPADGTLVREFNRMYERSNMPWDTDVSTRDNSYHGALPPVTGRVTLEDLIVLSTRIVANLEELKIRLGEWELATVVGGMRQSRIDQAVGFLDRMIYDINTLMSVPTDPTASEMDNHRVVAWRLMRIQRYMCQAETLYQLFGWFGVPNPHTLEEVD